MHERLAHRVQLPHAPDKGLAHLKKKNGGLHQPPSNDGINQGLELSISRYFHEVTLVEKAWNGKDECRSTETDSVAKEHRS